MINISVPARICFFGDHQDYLGLPVIAGAIDRYFHVHAKTNNSSSFDIFLKDLDKRIKIDLNDSLDNIQENDYVRSVMSILKKNGMEFIQGYDLEIYSTIPVNAGLSSSSALIVSWIRFLLQSQQFPGKPDNKQIGQWAYEAEVLFFDQPGGLMDQYSIAQGGLLFIDTESGESEPLNPKLGTLVVAESGLAKKTLSVLKNARVYAQNAIQAVQEQYPDFEILNATESDYERYKHLVPEKYLKHWYAAVLNFHITKCAKTELSGKNPNTKVLGDLMNQHQAILQNQIQNTPIEMQQMMEAAIAAGALGAKIIGSGGGGCMVAMVEEHTKQNVIEAFLNSGAKAAYPVNITEVS